MSDHLSDRFRWHPGTTVVVALAILAASLLGPPALAAWKAEEVTKDGVVHVMNPATSRDKPIEINLDEAWRIGGEDDDEIFGVITDIIADDDGNFYLLDSQLSEVKVYSNDGEWERSIGREGEGPGEFRGAFNLFRVPGGNIGVLQTFPGKVVTLTPDGEPADEYSLPEVEGAGFRILISAQYAGDNLALIYNMNQPSQTGFTQLSILSLVDADGKTEKQLHSQSSSMQAASPVIAETEWDSFRNGRWSASSDGHAFAAADYGEYTINVWDSNGKLVRVIHREYPEHTRTEDQKQDLLELYKGFTRQIPIPDIKYEINESYNPIIAIHARDDGNLWVQTSRGAFGLDDGIVGVFDVFDKDGKFVQQLTLRGEGDPRNDGYFFVGDRLFVVTDWVAALMALQGGGTEAAEAEDEPELMQVISYEVKSPGVGK